MNLKIAKPTETRPARKEPLALANTCTQQKTVRAARCSIMEDPFFFFFSFSFSFSFFFFFFFFSFSFSFYFSFSFSSFSFFFFFL
jgi:hypothetical protein